MVDIQALLSDLAEEQLELADLLSQLRADEWALPTPAPGWTIAHQVAHLAFFDEAVVLAVTNPDEFAEMRAAAARDPGFGEHVIRPFLDLSPARLLATWVKSSAESRQVLAHAPARVRIPWFGPSMSVASKVTARIMETWAHGQDVVDGCGLDRSPSARLRHVADLAVRARTYSYLVRGIDAVTTPVRVELVGPGGDLWMFGDETATDSVSGDAAEFCLVLTRRRHVDDTGLVATPGAARQWLEIGQAFAGDPGPGRRPGQFTALAT